MSHLGIQGLGGMGLVKGGYLLRTTERGDGGVSDACVSGVSGGVGLVSGGHLRLYQSE